MKASLSRLPENASESGFALVLVLAALAVLIPLGARVMVDTAVETRSVANLARRASLEGAAEAGINLGILRLVEAGDGTVPVAQAYWSAEGFLCRLEGETTIATRIADEAGKLDVNLVAPELLQRLLGGLGASEDAARAIANEIAALRDLGNERHGPFLTVDEVGGVAGMPAELFQAVRPFLTVHSSLPGFDPSVVSGELLERLSMNTGEAELGPFIVSSPRRTFTVMAVAAEGNARYGTAAVIELNQGHRPPYRVLQRQHVRPEKPAAATYQRPAEC